MCVLQLRSLKLENKELKRDARALVEKTAEWEEENRYLQVCCVYVYMGVVTVVAGRVAASTKEVEHSSEEASKCTGAGNSV